MALFKRNKEPVQNIEFSPESRADIQQNLETIQEELDMIHLMLTTMFEQKQRGELHDGEYNISADAYTTRQNTLTAERDKLLAQLDRANVGLAAAALNGSGDTRSAG